MKHRRAALDFSRVRPEGEDFIIGAGQRGGDELPAADDAFAAFSADSNHDLFHNDLLIYISPWPAAFSQASKCPWMNFSEATAAVVPSPTALVICLVNC